MPAKPFCLIFKSYLLLANPFFDLKDHTVLLYSDDSLEYTGNKTQAQDKTSDPRGRKLTIMGTKRLDWQR